MAKIEIYINMIDMTLEVDSIVKEEFYHLNDYQDWARDVEAKNHLHIPFHNLYFYENHPIYPGRTYLEFEPVHEDYGSTLVHTYVPVIDLETVEDFKIRRFLEKEFPGFGQLLFWTLASAPSDRIIKVKFNYGGKVAYIVALS